MNESGDPKRLGLSAALGTQLIWGFLPAWTALFPHTPPLQMLAYRAFFCLLTALILVRAFNQQGQLLALMRATRRWPPYVASAALIGVNWYIFFFAVQAGRILEVSFGYYLLPLCTIAVGVVVLKDKINLWTGAGLVAAALGVAVTSQSASGAPWLGIFVAVSFTFYTLVRKKYPIEPLVGFAFEIALLLPVALIVVTMVTHTTIVNPGDSIAHLLWLASFGPQTALSMALFNYAAHRLSMGTLGALQFVSPTIALAVALVGGEHMSATKLWGFAFMWLGVGFYLIDALKNRDAARRAQSAVEVDVH